MVRILNTDLDQVGPLLSYVLHFIIYPWAYPGGGAISIVLWYRYFVNLPIGIFMKVQT